MLGWQFISPTIQTQRYNLAGNIPFLSFCTESLPMRWVRNHTTDRVNQGLYRRALLLTVVGNLLLAITKSIVAFYSGSVAIYSDAANSISDVLYSAFMVLGLWLALRPPDLSHPQGHSRFEPLVGMLIAFSMTFAGFEAARASFVRFLAGGLAVEAGLPTLILVFSAAVKAAMFITIRDIARKVMSPTLQTSAKDNLSDVLASVAAFIGAAGSSLFHPVLDPLAGFLVAAWIFKAAFGAFKENLRFLTGGSASQELHEQIIDLTTSVPGVLRVHHLMTDYAGPKLVADLHVNVDGRTPLVDSHRITDEIITRLEGLPQIDRVYVHLEPDDWED